jgi:elongation factor G
MDDPILLSIPVEPGSDADLARLHDGVSKLQARGLGVQLTTYPDSRRVDIGAASESELETILDRLQREFGVAANVLGPPQVAYKETFTAPADGEMKYATQSAGRGAYGHVKIQVHPGEPGSGVVLDDAVIGGAIPEAFIGAVHDGLRDALTAGVLAGYPVDDVRIQLYDGSYHDVDSSDVAFRIAGAMAFRDAATKARPILLEPVMRVEVAVLDEHLDDVLNDLLARRGELLDQGTRRGMHILIARVPLAEMFGYAAALRERTLGRGTVKTQFARYQPCPMPDEGDAGESSVGAPRKRPPAPRVAGAAEPEPE